jgi:hypothetical protein
MDEEGIMNCPLCRRDWTKWMESRHEDDDENLTVFARVLCIVGSDPDFTKTPDLSLFDLVDVYLNRPLNDKDIAKISRGFLPQRQQVRVKIETYFYPGMHPSIKVTTNGWPEIVFHSTPLNPDGYTDMIIDGVYIQQQKPMNFDHFLDLARVVHGDRFQIMRDRNWQAIQDEAEKPENNQEHVVLTFQGHEHSFTGRKLW